MLLSTTFGQSLYEVHAVQAGEGGGLWVTFLTSAFVQGEKECYAVYEVEVLVRIERRVIAQHRRIVRLYSTRDERPINQNVLSWSFEALPSHARWEVLVWDSLRQTATMQSGTFSKDKWAIPFPEWGAGVSPDMLTPTLTVLYHLPAGIYLGQAALYQSESTLPELKRFLSIEERRFTLHASGGWDTLRLNWRVEELPAGAYLVGLYLYRGEALLYQSFYSVRRR